MIFKGWRGGGAATGPHVYLFFITEIEILTTSKHGKSIGWGKEKSQRSLKRPNEHAKDALYKEKAGTVVATIFPTRRFCSISCGP
jgi:hypothetical protein